ncbi:hypothetical protein NL533_31775, partial [Klebsiella pneumoniae]|nr:hypothetical protein [Klebsiella pneumoniae]
MTQTTTRPAEDLTSSTRTHDWRLLVGGELLPARSGATFDDPSPVTGRTIAAVPDAGADDVDAAV